MTGYDAIKMVTSVILDGSRSDRYLRKSDDGSYYTTPDLEYLTPDGRETPPYVRIPCCDTDITDDEAEHWAETLISQLDEYPI